MGEPPPWGESPPGDNDQNEIGFNLFEEWFHDNFLLEEIGDGIPQSPDFSLFDRIIEQSDSLNCNETVQSSNDSNFLDFQFEETSEHNDSIISNFLDEINTIEFDEGQGVVCSNRNQYLNGVENNNTNTTTNLPLSTLQVNTQSPAPMTGNDPVSQKVLHNDEILSAIYTGISNSPEEQQIPLISSPDTTIEVISDSNSVGNTSENGSVLLENFINLECELTEDNMQNQSAISVGTTMPINSQQTNQFNCSATGATTAAGSSQETNQFNQSAIIGANTAVLVSSQQTDQSNQPANGDGTAMTAISNQSNQFMQSAIGADTVLADASSIIQHIGPSPIGLTTVTYVLAAFVSPIGQYIPVLVPAPIPTNADSMRILQNQVSNAPNLPYPDERTRNRQERGKISSKKHRKKKKEEDKALKAKERDLSKENVDLREQFERLKREKEELIKMILEKKKKEEDKE